MYPANPCGAKKCMHHWLNNHALALKNYATKPEKPSSLKILQNYCAAKAIFYCPTMNSHRPRSQNTAKEQALIPEKESRRT
jgi:hypothetical protein